MAAHCRLIAASVAASFAVLAAAIAAVYWLRAPAPPADHPALAAGHALAPVAFADIPGWAADDHAAALTAFRRSCPRIPDSAEDWAAVCRAAETIGQEMALAFFERHFRAFRLDPASDDTGLLTAYYEPVVPGARTKSEDFPVPLYARPDDLVAVTEANRPAEFDPELTAARRGEDGLEPYPTRADIEDGRAGPFEPVAFVADPVEAFFIHIQGSTRIALADGGTMRVGFAAKNGHPYTSVGGVMMERGLRPEGGFSMDAMRAFFHAEPELARELMHENRSFIFFREIEGLDEHLGPVGAQSVPLSTGRSIAVDPAFHRLGTPIFLDAELPSGENRARQTFRRLMVAQDTGSAIKGAARADLFWGTGPQAGSVAGGIKEPGTFYLLLPRGRGTGAG